MNTLKHFIAISIFCFCAGAMSASGQTSAFTYQGKLVDAGANANGQYDFTFRLFPVAAGGAQIGADVARNDVPVADGVFTVNLDFGPSPFSSMTGQFLEILIRPGASTGTYTTLNPRLVISNTPYSVKSLEATNALTLGGVAANQYVLTTDPRMNDARNPLPNSANYIQNTAALQAASFNITGNGQLGGRLGVGATGTFAIDSPLEPGGRFTVLENGNVGLGTLFPIAKLELSGLGAIRARVNSDSNAGLALSLNNLPKWSVATVGSGQFQIFNDSLGQNAVWISETTNNVAIGSTASIFKLQVNDPSNRGLRVQTATSGGLLASFGGSGDFEIDSNGIPGGRFAVREAGGLVTINGRIATNFTRKLEVNGTISVNLGGVGIIPVCQNPEREIAVCVSSVRYKQNIRTFNPGLELAKRLRPVSFNWKTGNIADLGLIAEEVAVAEPLLATYNHKGEVEGVKYDRVGVVMINAVKEQQQQIEAQQKQITEQTDLIKEQSERLERQEIELDRQRSELEALKKLVCAPNAEAEICQPRTRF